MPRKKKKKEARKAEKEGRREREKYRPELSEPKYMRNMRHER